MGVSRLDTDVERMLWLKRKRLKYSGNYMGKVEAEFWEVAIKTVIDCYPEYNWMNPGSRLIA